MLPLISKRNNERFGIMLIKDVSYLKKLRKNYDEEIGTIEKVFDYFLEIVDKNLINYLADGYIIVHKKNYLFSSQLKEIYFNDGTVPNCNVTLAYNYEKDGSVFLVIVNSKEIIENLLPGCPFDEISISPSLKRVNFSMDGDCCVVINYAYDSGNYMLYDYSGNFDLLKKII